MESDHKKSQSKWHSNMFNHFKKLSETEKNKETTKEMEGKLKLPQSFKLPSNMINLFKKLSLRSETNISSETAPLNGNEKKWTESENFAIKTIDVNGTQKNNLNENSNHASSSIKKSTLQKCKNKISFDKKKCDNSENAFCFDKNIKVEESEDKSNVAPNNLRTTLCNTEVKVENVGRLVNTDPSKNLNIEEKNELDSKSEFPPVSSNEHKFYNNSGFYKSPSKDSGSDCKSTLNDDKKENTQDDEVFERGIEKTNKSINTHRINPLQRKADQGKIPVRDTIAEADEIIDGLIKNYRQQDSFKVWEEIDKAIVIELSKSLPFGVKSKPYSDTDFCEADEELAKRKRAVATPESDCSSPSFQLNDCYYESATPESDCSSPSFQLNDCYYENESATPESDCSSPSFQLNDCYYENESATPESDCSSPSFQLNNCYRENESATSESDCSSPSFQLNDCYGENESVEDFLYGIQNYINYFFQCNNLDPNSLPNSMDYSKLTRTALENFWYPAKNGYSKSIASKDQQTGNYELNTKARNRLFNSRAFSKEKCCAKYLEMYSQIRAGEFGTIEKKVIHNLKPTGVKKYRRTNLHAAVMDGHLEDTFCIVEMHKQYHKEISFHINIRDNKGKTVLDRAEENESSMANSLLIKYLQENNAQNSIHHMLPINIRRT